MLKLIIELHPMGYSLNKKKIAEAIIYNDGTGDVNTGNYCYELKGQTNRILKQGKIKGFKRKKDNVYKLLKLILNDAYNKK